MACKHDAKWQSCWKLLRRAEGKIAARTGIGANSSAKICSSQQSMRTLQRWLITRNALSKPRGILDNRAEQGASLCTSSIGLPNSSTRRSDLNLQKPTFVLCVHFLRTGMLISGVPSGSLLIPDHTVLFLFALGFFFACLHFSGPHRSRPERCQSVSKHTRNVSR